MAGQEKNVSVILSNAWATLYEMTCNVSFTCKVKEHQVSTTITELYVYAMLSSSYPSIFTHMHNCLNFEL